MSTSKNIYKTYFYKTRVVKKYGNSMVCFWRFLLFFDIYKIFALKSFISMETVRYCLVIYTGRELFTFIYHEI